MIETERRLLNNSICVKLVAEQGYKGFIPSKDGVLTSLPVYLISIWFIHDVMLSVVCNVVSSCVLSKYMRRGVIAKELREMQILDTIQNMKPGKCQLGSSKTQIKD